MLQKLNLPLVLALGICFQSFALASSTSGAQKNIALHKPVFAAPAPNDTRYKVKDDVSLLTNGKITPKGQHIWLSGQAVAWKYAGRVNLAIDLQKMSYVNEFAIRMRGGAGAPGWFEVVASQDGKHWTTIKQVSRFDTNYRQEFARLTDSDTPRFLRSSNVFKLRFTNLDVDAKWIGLRMYTSRTLTGLSDQLYVYGHHLKDGARPRPLTGKPAGFSVRHPQPYFIKPYILLATNVVTPLPIGIVPAAKGIKHKSNKPLTFTLDIPKGVQILGGRFLSPGERVKVDDAKITILDSGAKQYQFTIPAPKKKFGHGFGRLYVKATGWKDGQKGAIHYQFGQGDWQSEKVSVPVIAVTLPKAPRLKHIMVNLGWWWATNTVNWPDALQSFRHIGLNTFPIFAYYRRNDYPNGAAWKLLEKAREQGFFISNIDSTFTRVVQQHGKNNPEMFHQVKNAPKHLDPSYRGKWYKWAINRFAQDIARVKPDFTSQDVEQWRHDKLKLYQKCARCQKAFAASGYKSWDEWRYSLGDQMWHDAIGAARAALKKEGANPHFDTGNFALRPGINLDHIQNFDHLYPKYFTHSEPYVYGPYYAPLLLRIAKRVRADRKKLKGNDVMPWLTPGNAGTYPASTMQWALLESYTNGARGVWFWNGKLWDGEDLIAINRVVRAIAPVEEIIVKGDLVGSAAEVVGDGHVSGMQRGGNIVLLVSDYFGKTNGKVKLKLNLPKNVTVYDLLDNQKELTSLKAGEQDFIVNLNGKEARLLWLKPIAK